MLIHNYNNPEKKKLYNFQVVGILDGGNREHSYQAFASIEDIKKMRKFMMEGSQNNNNNQRNNRAMSREIAMKGGRAAVRVYSARGGMPGYNPDDYSFILVRTQDVSKTRELSKSLREMGYNSHSIADALEGIEKTSDRKSVV